MHSINDDYEAMCDISSGMSCTRVLTSEYGHLFSYIGLFPKESVLDQSNAFYGLLFYVIMAFFGAMRARSEALQKLNLVLAFVGIGLSAVLAYILKFVLADLCIVCVSTYVCNTAIFLDSYSEYSSLGGEKKKSK